MKLHHCFVNVWFLPILSWSLTEYLTIGLIWSSFPQIKTICPKKRNQGMKVEMEICNVFVYFFPTPGGVNLKKSHKIDQKLKTCPCYHYSQFFTKPALYLSSVYRVADQQHLQVSYKKRVIKNVMWLLCVWWGITQCKSLLLSHMASE